MWLRSSRFDPKDLEFVGGGTVAAVGGGAVGDVWGARCLALETCSRLAATRWTVMLKVLKLLEMRSWTEPP